MTRRPTFRHLSFELSFGIVLAGGACTGDGSGGNQRQRRDRW